MSFTNVNIPDRFEIKMQLMERIHDLESKIKWLNQMLDKYESELHNIPKAILEHGHVMITFDQKTIKVGQIP